MTGEMLSDWRRLGRQIATLRAGRRPAELEDEEWLAVQSLERLRRNLALAIVEGMRRGTASCAAAEVVALAESVADSADLSSAVRERQRDALDAIEGLLVSLPLAEPEIEEASPAPLLRVPVSGVPETRRKRPLIAGFLLRPRADSPDRFFPSLCRSLLILLALVVASVAIEKSARMDHRFGATGTPVQRSHPGAGLDDQAGQR
jgi:hypothetical protein